MDKKSFIGLLLIGVILFGFAWFNSKQAQKYEREKAVADSIARAEGRIVEQPFPLADAPDGEQAIYADPGYTPSTVSGNADSIRTARYGSALLSHESGEEREHTIENDFLRITFTNKGGKISGVELKDYKTYYGEPLNLYAEGSAQFDMVFFLRNQHGHDLRINTGDYYFDWQPQGADADGSSRYAMRLPVDSMSYVEYIYTVPKADYMIGYEVNFVNMDHMFSNSASIQFAWERIGLQSEKSFSNENRYSTVAYKFPGDDGLEDIGTSENSKKDFVKNSVQWIAFKQQFFSSVFIAENKNFTNAELSYDTYLPDGENLKKYHADVSILFNRNDPNYKFKFYYGPNKYSLLKSYDQGMERLVPLGWSIVRWVNKWVVIPVFDFLETRIANYGIIILLLTLLVKIIILPLTYKSYLSMGKMRLIKPEVDAINEKYPKKEDALKKQQATMELYKKAGVSPMGGCIPLLIQFPIIVALFYFFPTSIELRGESFLWADDLSSYDSILNLPFKIPFYGSHISLFALFMAVSLIISTKLNSQASAGSQMPSLKFITYFMPVMFLFLFNSYASGLTYYYFLSNLITMGQMWGFRYIVNDEKLRAKMNANAGKKKAKKKSKFQQRYEEMVKAQQQQRGQQVPQGKKKKK